MIFAREWNFRRQVVYGYVQLIRVDFSLPKIQNGLLILTYSSRPGPDFLSFTPEQDPFLITWSGTSKLPVDFMKDSGFCPNYLSKKYACLLAKDTDYAVNTNKPTFAPVGSLVFCSQMLTYSCKKE